MNYDKFKRKVHFRIDYDYFLAVVEPEFYKSGMEEEEFYQYWLENDGIQRAYDTLKKERDVKIRALHRIMDIHSAIDRAINARSFRRIQNLSNTLDKTIPLPLHITGF